MPAETYKVRSMDGVHDLLLKIGDLRRDELLARCISPEIALTVERLRKSLRVLEVSVAGEKRLIAVEDAGRYRDALGVPLPPGLPTAFQVAVPDAALDLLRRFGRTHGPFTTAEIAKRFGLALETAEAVLNLLVQTGRIVEGGFRPGGVHREWCDHEVLRTIRRRSLARLRREVEPVEQATLARLFARWQGVVQPRRGLDALLDVIENLQGAPVPASVLESEVLPARLFGYKSADLDTLIAAGEVVWCGVEAIGEKDGRVALYLSEKLPVLWPVTPTSQDSAQGPTAEREGRSSIIYAPRSFVLSGAARRHRRRLSRRDARGGLELGVARPAEQRCAACAAGLLRSDRFKHQERQAGAEGASTDRLPLTANHSSYGAGTLVAECGRLRREPERDRVEPRHRPAVAGALRSRLSRDGACGRTRGWVLGGLRCAEGTGREWPGTARVFRGGPRSDAVRDACGGRPAAQLAREARWREERDADAGGDRSGQSVWLAIEVAGRRGTRDRR